MTRADVAPYIAAAEAGTLTDGQADEWLTAVTGGVPGCTHTPRCPAADAVDHDAARVVHHDEDFGLSVLCNGVVCFTDGAELVPDDTDEGGPCHCHIVQPHRPEPRHRENR